MNRINPVTAETCQPHYGSPVCVITNDGRQYIGILSAIRGGKLILNENVAAAGETEAPRKKRKTAQTQSFPLAGSTEFSAARDPNPWFGHPFFREKIAIELTSIALLLLLII